MDDALVSSKGPRKRGRETGRDTERAEDDANGIIDEKSISNLTTFLAREENALRVRAKEILNKDLIAQADAFASLEERLESYASYQEALDGGFIAEVRTCLSKTYRMGIKLEAWINTFTPPLSAGGNLGVSGEVQDGIYAHVHGLTTACSDALHRALAFEKEFAVQKTKCTDVSTWERYRTTLEANMLHDVFKAILQAQGDLMNVANSISNNLAHLKPPSEEKHIANMY